MHEPQNWPSVRFLPGQNTQGFSLVKVINPPRYSSSGFWGGNEPNQTKARAEHLTPSGLPGPVPNTSQLTYSTRTRRIQPRISSLSNDIQEHPRSSLLSRLMVSDLTTHADSIQGQLMTSCNSLLTYDTTPGTPLNWAYPLRITLDCCILLHSKHIWCFLNWSNLWLPAHKVSLKQALKI